MDTTKENSKCSSKNNHPVADGQTSAATENGEKPNAPTTTNSLSPAPAAGQNQIASTPSSPRNNNGDHKDSSAIQQQKQPFVPTGGIANPQMQVRSRKETLEAKRERKAAKTLAIITGAFGMFSMNKKLFPQLLVTKALY